MSAQIIPFPIRHRPPQPRRVCFDVVRVLPGEHGETWCIAGSIGELHDSFDAAMTDAFGVAADYGVPIVVEVPHA
jgi:hypothetical protein